jgi:hypothetical protein
MKNLAVHVLARKYQLTQQYANWYQNFGTQEVFVYDKYSSDRTAEIMAVPISSGASAATMGYGCKNSVLSFVLFFCV